MGKRKGDDDSSLELLLDTMCNTFGGVMFIAILLAVMVSMRSQVKEEPVPEDPKQKIEEVRQRITKLQTELDVFTRKTQEMAQKLEDMQSDPRLRLVHEIALLEQMYKERQLTHKIQIQKVNVSRAALTEAELETLKVLEEKKINEEALKKLLEEKKKKEISLQDLNKKLRSVNLKNIVFTTQVKKTDIPYFIFVNDGKIWPVGPEIKDDSYTPNPAVTYQIKGSLVSCSPVAARGTAIFSGEDLSAEFLGILKNLPSNRVPEFVISKSDAEVFYRLREALKKHDILHGFRVQIADSDVFDYQFSAGGTNINYEY